MPNNTTSLVQAAFSSISVNEVGGVAATADHITAPHSGSNSNGVSGWTIGFNQEDFRTNPSQAQQTLISALVASGNFSSQNATAIAVALTNAGQTTSINLSGITGINGQQATVENINSALLTPAAKNSVYQSSFADFSNTFNNTISNISSNSNINSAVLNALNDPVEGALLQIVLSDYANQYGISNNNGASPGMMQLLISGSTTQNGNTVTLDTQSAAGIVQSVETMALDSLWTSHSNGAQACTRLANDVAAAVAYDNSLGESLAGNETLTSQYGTCVITPNANGTSFTGQWTSGSISGSATDVLDTSGEGSDPGGSSESGEIASQDTITTNSDGAGVQVTETDTAYADGSASSDIQANGSAGNVLYTQTAMTDANGNISATISGQGDQSALTNATITLSAGSSADILGVDNIISAGSGASIMLGSGSDNEIIDTVTGQDITILNGTINVAGVSGPVSAGVTDVITLNSDGSFSLGVQDGNGQQTDNDIFNPSGELTQDQQFRNGKVAGIEYYSGGAAVDNATYDAAGDLSAETLYTGGAIYSDVHYLNGAISYQDFYDLSHKKIAETDYANGKVNAQFLYDTSTGNILVENNFYSLGPYADTRIFYSAGYGPGIIETVNYDAKTGQIVNVHLPGGLYEASDGGPYFSQIVYLDATGHTLHGWTFNSQTGQETSFTSYDGTTDTGFADGLTDAFTDTGGVTPGTYATGFSLPELTGTPGADILTGKPGVTEVFDGEGGNDLETGFGGTDVFGYKAGYGHLEINETGSISSVLSLGEGISGAALQVSFDSGDDVILTDGVAGDRITLDMMAAASFYGVQQVRFADGTLWSAQELLALGSNVTGTTGADRLYGSPGADTFDGKGGNDVETGKGGNDTFVYNAGYGSLEINETGSSASVLKLGAGITAASMQALFDSGTDIILTDGVTGDQIKLDAMAAGNNSGVQSVQLADGTVLTAQQVLALAHNVTGTSGADTLYGSTGADVFDGKGGNDVETGKGGNDTFVYNAGYGSLEINETGSTASMLTLGAGLSVASMQFAFDSGTDVIMTDSVTGDRVKLDGMENNTGGVQSVQFDDGTVLTTQQVLTLARTVTGTTGADTLYGSSGADTFDGKGGNDVETGRGGNDTFVYNAGYGNLEINETGSTASVLELGAGITATSVQVTFDSSNDVILADGVTGDRIKLDGMASSSTAGVQSVQFADGAVWTAQQLLTAGHNLTGSAGADTLYGSSDADTFDGKGGNDVEFGQGGNDTFIYNAGYGHLEINESGSTASVLELGAGIDAASLTARSSGNSLVLTDGIAGDQITIDSMLVYAYRTGIQTVQFADGTTLNLAQLITLETTGTSGADVLTGRSDTAAVFDGKGGNDVETGYGANDTFIYNSGYGDLEINESYSSASVLKLGAGITLTSLTATDSGNNLILTDGVTGDQITLDNMLKMTNGGVREVMLADGTTLTRSQLVTLETTGTSGADALFGVSSAPAVFDGKGGNDVETGYGASDTFIYNSGYGNLEINETYAPGSMLKLGTGISASAVSVSFDAAGDVIMADGVAGDRIKLDGMATSNGFGVQSVQFADGTTWTAQQVLAAGSHVAGTSGADTLYGSPGADVFDGNGGGDIEYGKGGKDTYVMQPGYGSLEIVNGVANSSVAAGDLSIENVNPDNIWLKQVGNNLQISILGSTTEATIDNWFSNTYSQLSEVTVSGGSSGSLTLDSQMTQLIQAMATFSANNPGFDVTSSANATITDPTVLAAVNSAWHH